MQEVVDSLRVQAKEIALAKRLLAAEERVIAAEERVQKREHEEITAVEVIQNWCWDDAQKKHTQRMVDGDDSNHCLYRTGGNVVMFAGKSDDGKCIVLPVEPDTDSDNQIRRTGFCVGASVMCFWRIPSGQKTTCPFKSVVTSVNEDSEYAEASSTERAWTREKDVTIDVETWEYGKRVSQEKIPLDWVVSISHPRFTSTCTPRPRLTPYSPYRKFSSLHVDANQLSSLPYVYECSAEADNVYRIYAKDGKRGTRIAELVGFEYGENNQMSEMTWKYLDSKRKMPSYSKANLANAIQALKRTKRLRLGQ